MWYSDYSPGPTAESGPDCSRAAGPTPSAPKQCKSDVHVRSLYTVFKHCIHLQPIWLQILVAIDSESSQTSSQSLCAPTSEVDVLFYLNLSSRPFLGQVVDLDLLLCTRFDLEHADLSLCPIFIQ